MLLAIDIGNTNVVLALLDAEDRVLEERRAPSKDGWTAEQYAAQIHALLCGRAVRGAAVSSVVPLLTVSSASLGWTVKDSLCRFCTSSTFSVTSLPLTVTVPLLAA